MFAKPEPTKPAAAHTGCRGCATPWPDDQLVWRSDDETWSTTCTHCGLRQPWAWVR